MSVNSILSLSGCEIGYRARSILKDVTFEIAAGEITALIGPNGAGKTTLLKSMVGILPLLSGEVRFLSEDRRPEIGYVPQRERFDPIFPLTVLDVVSMGGYRCGGRSARVLALEMLERVGLGELAAQGFFELSGGQKQRALIARALVLKPKILFLDEPTAGVDPGAEQGILELLKRIKKEDEVTVIMVSHHLRTLRGFVDSVIVVHHGGVLKGASADFLAPGHLEELFGYLG